MPGFNILGLEIWIPSVDEIVNAVLAPINTLVLDIQNTVINTLSPLFSNIINVLSPLFSTLLDSVTSFFSGSLTWLTDTLGAAWAGIQALPGQISGGLEALGTSLSDGIASTGAYLSEALAAAETSLSDALATAGADITGALAGAQSTLEGALGEAGARISGALETVQNGLLVAFDGMGNAIAGTLGGILSGFGSIDPSAVLGATFVASAQNLAAILGLEAHHSPISPEEAAGFVPNFSNQVEAACVTLHTANIILEGVSLGQIDVSLTEAWGYPNTAAAIGVATDLVAMPLKEGLYPAYKRYILSSYVPNIPDFNSLMSIYVKEGYLEDHWVEMPEEMAQNFRELGYSEDWAKRLWGQHWQYPSPSQLFEMLHRTAGNFPEIGVSALVLRDMLKLHDYEPKWRGPLEAISWRTWRIYDIRTGWEMGLLGEEDLKKRLIDSGYEPKDAALVLEVQKMFVLRSEIDSLMTESTTDYEEGWISLDQLKTDFKATPYNQGVQELRVARAQLRRDRDQRKAIKAALQNRFIKGDLTEAEYKQELSRLGLVQEWITATVEAARAQKLTKVKEETVLAAKSLGEAKYSRAFKVGLFTEEQYRRNLAALKYEAEDIDLLVELNTPEKPAPEEVKALTVAELKSAFRVGVLDETELRAELAARKYPSESIDVIVETEKAKIKTPAAETA